MLLTLVGLTVWSGSSSGISLRIDKHSSWVHFTLIAFVSLRAIAWATGSWPAKKTFWNLGQFHQHSMGSFWANILRGKNNKAELSCLLHFALSKITTWRRFSLVLASRNRFVRDKCAEIIRNNVNHALMISQSEIKQLIKKIVVTRYL